MTSTTQVLEIAVGVAVLFNGRPHRITRVLDLNAVLVADNDTQIISSAKIRDLSVVAPATMPPADWSQLPDADWAEASRRYELIRPLLDQPQRTRQQVIAQAQKVGCHENTLYGWINRYEATGSLTALIPHTRSDQGLTKLSAEVEALITQVIETEYLTRQAKSMKKVCIEVRRRCLNADLPPPHDNTVRKRIKALASEQVVSRRRGRKVGESLFSPIQGPFPGADTPWAVVQIDHTPLDIILVDDLHRRPIGRPWLTLAIDVCSRMVVGFYVSFDPPGALAAGQCLANAILPKDTWLAKHGIQGEWPCWGIPAKLHMDNAREFRGQMLQRASQEYRFDIEWRPVARPHFGGHIERLLGTFAKEIHALPGTTFSNTQQRGDYPAEEKAALTLTEFEKWFVTLIVQVYHQRVHSGLGMPPLERYRQGIFGTNEMPGCGLPPRINDELTLRLNLMPYEERSIKDYGVVIDQVHYYHDVLRRWINATDPVQPKLRRRFLFRRDPRDISTIWFYDPNVQGYYPIPYRDTSHPPISVWELREAQRHAKAEGLKHIDERALFTAYGRLREIEQQAQAKTVAARRASQRRTTGQAVAQALVAAAAGKTPQPPAALSQASAPIPSIEPFDELDDLL